MDEDGVHFKRAIMRIQKDRTITRDRLRRMGLRVIPSHANFIMFETPLPAMSVYDALIQSGIIVRPCNAWGYDHMLRVSIGATEQMNAFAETLSVILKDAESADWK
jgi:histidinol-phosphate aminotransferase